MRLMLNFLYPGRTENTFKTFFCLSFLVLLRQICSKNVNMDFGPSKTMKLTSKSQYNQFKCPDTITSPKTLSMFLYSCYTLNNNTFFLIMQCVFLIYCEVAFDDYEAHNNLN